MTRPLILVFDSGLGGLTVFRATLALRPDADYLYVADDAGFPYGPKQPEAVVARVMDVAGKMIRRRAPSLVVIACNTASTIVLPPLRDSFPEIPFVGTVPAIKPAAATTRTGMISVLATPGTVARDYTRDLIAAHAAACRVTLVGAPDLAALAEDHLRERRLDEAAVALEILPCFVDDGVRRTDTVVLACTHYPLLLDVFERHAPWPVTWVDPAPAIARRVATLLAHRPQLAGPGARTALFTSGRQPEAALRNALTGFGFGNTDGRRFAACA